jgi:hypothetical protein
VDQGAGEANSGGGSPLHASLFDPQPVAPVARKTLTATIVEIASMAVDFSEPRPSVQLRRQACAEG